MNIKSRIGSLRLLIFILLIFSYPRIVHLTLSRIVSSRRNSSGSDDSGTDDDKEDRRKNTIPDWARGAQLKDALEVEDTLIHT